MSSNSFMSYRRWWT